MNLSMQQLEEKIDAFLAENESSFLQDLTDVIAIPSVLAPAEENAPFGKPVADALACVLAAGQRLGMKTGNQDGYMGWVEVEGQSPKYLATITHLDVVPQGDGWDGSPFALRLQEGWLLGRGVGDDKGPGIACLYVAKFFKELGVPLPYTMRFLYGTNEETGMEDVAPYLAKHPQPAFCMTPDASFPVCYGEKGNFSGNFISTVLGGNLLDFKGGIADNVIPDKAYCVVKAPAHAPKSTDAVKVSTLADGSLRLDGKGIGGHAAKPAGTKNAIGLLVEYLLDNHLCTPQEEEVLCLLQKLHTHTDGSGVGIAAEDGIFTPLTCVGCVISFEDKKLVQNFNIRFPSSISGEKIAQILATEAETHSCTLCDTSYKNPFHIPVNTPHITALMDAYQLASGRDDKPFTMGGGTYARHFKSAVSFGPGIPGREYPSFAGPEHGANEGILLADLLLTIKVYILALWKLQQLEW